MTKSRLLYFASWGMTALVVVLGVLLAWRVSFGKAAANLPTEQIAAPAAQPEPVVLPGPWTAAPLQGITRLTRLKTIIPERPTYKTIQYTVQKGDSPWSIAQQFGLQPETILWANDGLSASAGSLRPGATLNILPVDGVLHTAREGDTLERLERLHGAPAQEILEFPGNEFDLTQEPELQIGQQIIIPNGRSAVIWEEPGPNLAAASAGRSSTVPLVNIGSGAFVWPIAPPYTITQPFWGGHPGIDLDAYYRQPIFAADSGTVIYSGWDDTGYGNFIIIDHGNGYQTYYGHNEANLVSVGQGVVQGQQIAEAGSTGNSTGDHLDFRIRIDGGAFLDPLDFLP